MVSALIRLLAALFEAIPSIKEIAQYAMDMADKANKADAIERKTTKDKAVDNAIDGKSSDDGSGGNIS